MRKKKKYVLPLLAAAALLAGTVVLWYAKASASQSGTTVQEADSEERYALDYAGILQLDWSGLDAEELDKYLEASDAACVGYLLESLSPAELQELEQKSELLHQQVNISTLENSAEEDMTYEFEKNEKYEFAEYCRAEYQAVRGKAGVSEWRYKNGTGVVFYISDHARKNVWKYEVKGFNECYITDTVPEANTLTAQVESNQIKVVETCIKGADGKQYTTAEGVKYKYHHPTVNTIKAVPYSTRGYMSTFTSDDGTYTKTSYNPEKMAMGTDDGAILYSLSISFKNFLQEATGYHVDATEGNVAILKYNTNNTAMTYVLEVVTTKGDDGSTVAPYYKFLTKEEAIANQAKKRWTDNDTYYKQTMSAKKMIKGTETIKYGGHFKSGVVYDSTKPKEYYNDKMTGGSTKTKTVYRTYGEDYIVDTDDSFALQFTSANLGTDMYSEDGKAVMSSDKPEYVIQMTENAYSVVYHGNGSTSGSTSKQSVTYTETFKLRSNGFTKTGWKFKEWNTKADGSGTSYAPGTSVKSLTKENGGTVDLYAIWQLTVIYHANGGKAASGYILKNNLAYQGTEKENSRVEKILYPGTNSVNLHNVKTLFTKTGYAPTSGKEWKIGSATSTKTISEASGVTALTELKAAGNSSGIVTLYANWEAKDVSYKVEHYQQQTTGNKYDLVETVTAKAKADSTVSPAVKSYTGFVSPAVQSVKVAADGSTVIKYYYTRRTYTVTLSSSPKEAFSSVTGAGTYRYGATVTLNAILNPGYHWLKWTGWKEYPSQQSSFSMPAENVTLIAMGEANQYTVRFDKNQDGIGTTVGSMADITATVNQSFKLPLNQYIRTTDAGTSQFLGWSREPSDRMTEFPDGCIIQENLALEQNAVITLYAIWDDCPWIEASDRYFNLWWAQNGKITEEELLSTVSATDREDVTLEVRTAEQIAEAGEASSVSLSDYDISVFTSMTEPGEVSVTYKAVDSGGNVVYKEIVVHVYDTSPLQPTESMYLRYINKKYYEKSYEEGGLHPDSVWRTDAAYKATLENALNNLENGTPERVYSFTAEEVAEAKKYVDEHGFSDTKEANALQGFFDRFMR